MTPGSSTGGQVHETGKGKKPLWCVNEQTSAVGVGLSPVRTSGDHVDRARGVRKLGCISANPVHHWLRAPLLAYLEYGKHEGGESTVSATLWPKPHIYILLS